MADPVNPQEHGSTKSSESDVSAELFADEVKSDYHSSKDDEAPSARHEPIINWSWSCKYHHPTRILE